MQGLLYRRNCSCLAALLLAVVALLLHACCTPGSSHCTASYHTLG
jgi:hypothetical protein